MEQLLKLGLARSVTAICGLVFAAALPLQTAADPVADFYTGRTVTVAIGSGPVGGYAIYARLAIDHMPEQAEVYLADDAGWWWAEGCKLHL